MTADELLRPLASPLRDLVRWLDGRREPYAVIGGVAASLLGKPRVTGDIDAVILTDERKLAALLVDAKSHGFAARVDDAAVRARANRVVQLQHIGDKVNVDLSLAGIAFERLLIERARRVPALGVKVPLARAEELIPMKVLAFRGRDVTDIETLLDANPRVDLKEVRRWVKLLAEAAELPEIVERFEALMARRLSLQPRQSRRKKR